jgi:hypothetical protein
MSTPVIVATPQLASLEHCLTIGSFVIMRRREAAARTEFKHSGWLASYLRHGHSGQLLPSQLRQELHLGMGPRN